MNNIIIQTMIQIKIIIFQKKKEKTNLIIIRNIPIYVHMNVTNIILIKTKIHKKMKKNFQ